MRRIIAFFLIILCTIPLLFSCGKEDDTEASQMAEGSSDGDITISDGSGNDDAFTIEERKSTYGDEDLAILYVKNNTENEYSLTVSVSFFDTDGKEAAGDMTKTRTVFAGLETCYIFRPMAKFFRFEYKLSAEKKESLSNGGFSIPSHVTVELIPNPVDLYEKREIIRATVSYSLKIQNDFPEAKWLSGNFVLFDNTGEIYAIQKFNKSVAAGLGYEMGEIILDGVSWKDGLTLPENLEGQLEIAFDYEYSDVTW